MDDNFFRRRLWILRLLQQLWSRCDLGAKIGRQCLALVASPRCACSNFGRYAMDASRTVHSASRRASEARGWQQVCLEHAFSSHTKAKSRAHIDGTIQPRPQEGRIEWDLF